MVLDPIPQPLPVHFFGFRPQPPTSRYECILKQKHQIRRVSKLGAFGRQIGWMKVQWVSEGAGERVKEQRMSEKQCIYSLSIILIVLTHSLLFLQHTCFSRIRCSFISSLRCSFISSFAALCSFFLLKEQRMREKQCIYSFAALYSSDKQCVAVGSNIYSHTYTTLTPTIHTLTRTHSSTHTHTYTTLTPTLYPQKWVSAIASACRRKTCIQPYAKHASNMPLTCL